MINPIAIDEDEAIDLYSCLTPQEKRVSAMVAGGFQAPAIAGFLGLSESTIRKHRDNAVKRLGVRNSYALAAICCVALRAVET
jgi:DNA-binding NarL/FixJ family response regulator